MRCNAPDTRADGEGDLHHLVERWFISRSAEGAMILVPVDGPEGSPFLENTAASRAEHVPGYLKQTDRGGMQERCDDLLLVKAVSGRKGEGVDAVEVAVRS